MSLAVEKWERINKKASYNGTKSVGKQSMFYTENQIVLYKGNRGHLCEGFSGPSASWQSGAKEYYNVTPNLMQ